MGSQEHEEEGPLRHVTVASFSIDRFDVTNGRFAEFVYGPTSSIVGYENEPFVQVSYNDALAFARWAGRELGH